MAAIAGGLTLPMAPGLLICAPRSGSGKTMLMLGLLRAFAKAGVAVGAAKCGPDYIDPAFHAAASGRPSINLDGFAMAPALVRGLAALAGRDADLIVAEGAMGLFDGAGRAQATGASADVARLLGWPMLLVIDASGAGQSVAATALGCIAHPRAPALAGVIANRIASPRHARLVAQGFAELDLPLLGLVGEDRTLALPSRHLGLVQAAEIADLDALLDRVADRVTRECDLDRIAAAARPATPSDAGANLPPSRLRPPGQRIAVARDEAFAFFYPHLELAWRASGAELIAFSPLADEPPPPHADACWLPGGYPELHAGRLAGNRRLLDGLRAFAETRPIHGECGGYMLLGRTLEDSDGITHAMADLLPVATSFATRRRTLGYRSATLREDCALGAAGTRFGGHEFHYATIAAEEGPPLFDLTDGDDQPLPPAGHRRGQVSGSFFHLIA